MTFQTVLTSDQYAKLRSGTYACAQHISVLRPVVELKARLSATPNGTSFANVSYGSVISGSYTTVMPGMTILISHEDNIRKAHFTGQVRDITSSTIGINETSAGLIANDYLWIIRDWRLQPKLAREVGGAQFKDYAQAYAGQNPIIYNLKAAYADWVDPTSGALRISFTPLDFAAQSGATISSRAWSTLPSGATLISGSLSDANITVDFDPGDYFLHYTVTDSGGRAQVRHIPIFAHDDTINPPALSFTSASIANSSAAWTANLRGFADIDDVLDGTLVVCWNEEYYNGEPGSIYDNIAGVFRLRRESLDGRADPTYSYDADASFELEDIATQLSRLTAPLIALRNVGSPTVWDEIANLTPYRAICHILETGSTFNSIHSLSFDAFDNIFECDSLNISGSLLGAIQDVARSINAVPEFAADGRCIVARDARYLDNTARQALPIIAAFTDGSGGTTSDLIDVSYQHGHTRDAGRVDASGGTYQTSSGRVDPFLAIAPGSASEGGEGRPSLTGQILAANSAAGVAKAELISRAANLLEIANGPDRLIVTHPDGYHWLTPSISQWYTFNLGETLALRGMSFNGATRWLLESVSLEPDNVAGTVAVRATYVRETYGYGGIAFEPPTAGEIAPYVPDLPGFGPYDFAFPELPELVFAADPLPVDLPPILSTPPTTGSTSVARDGNTVLIWDDSHVWVTRQFLKSADPSWVDVTPDSTHTVQYADLDPFPDSAGHVGAYALTVLSEMSFVWYCPDVFAAAPEWTKGAGVNGTYTILRTTSTKGSVLLYNPSGIASITDGITFDAGGAPYAILGGVEAAGGNPDDCLTSDLSTSWTRTLDFTRSSYGFTGTGTWVAGVGWMSIGSDLSITSPTWAAFHLDRINIYFTPDYPAKTDLYTLPDGTLQTHGIYITGSNRFPDLDDVTGVQLTSTTGVTVSSLVLQGTTVNPFGGNPSVRRTLDSASTVTAVSMDHQKDLTGSTIRTVAFYDASNVLLDTLTTTSNPGNNVWDTDSYTGLAIANVKHIVYSVAPAAGGTDANLWLDNAVVTYNGGSSGNATVTYSDDYGATFGSEIDSDTSPGSSGGFDRIVIGDTSLAAAEAQVKTASTLGGAYSDETNGAVAGTYPLTILIPSHKQNSASVTNYSTATPEYILATPALVSGAAVWWVKPTGKVDITPTISATKGLAVAPDTVASWRGTILAAVLAFSGTRHLVVSTNGGTAWTDRGTVDSSATMVKTRRRAAAPGQVFWANGDQVGYSANLGVTKVYKSTPSMLVKGIEAWG